MSSDTIGIGLPLLGGVLVGNCMLPLRKIRTWAWECSWLVFSIVSLVLVPCLLAWLTLPHWPSFYFSVSASDLLPPFLFGVGWGVAQVLFGLAVVRLGMLIPFFVRHEASLISRSSVTLLSGCFLMIIGVSLSGWAGKLREVPGASSKGKEYRSGLLIAVVSGVLSSMLNLSFSFGQSLTHAALGHGAAPSLAVLAVWPIALAGGFLPNFGFTLYLLVRNRSWNGFLTIYPDFFLSLLMGLLWIFAVALYGIAAHQLGRLGDSAGWAIYQITMVLTACAAGVFSGEWKRASRRSIGIFTAGIATLAVAILMVSSSTR
jgi:L-rhamnose-H+ transport protein